MIPVAVLPEPLSAAIEDLCDTFSSPHFPRMTGNSRIISRFFVVNMIPTFRTESMRIQGAPFLSFAISRGLIFAVNRSKVFLQRGGIVDRIVSRSPSLS